MATRPSMDGVELLKPPPQQAGGLQRPESAHSTTASSGGLQSLRAFNSVQEDVTAPAVKPGHQRFVLTDPVAFRYLEDDASTIVLERRRELTGYECYIVEQWTTSRTHPTFVITTYTGDPAHVVIVGVLSVPIDESTWSPRLRVYFKALNQYHARRRETPLGIMMITNLAGFPSSLTVIPIPGGDPTKYRFEFFVNENLKRLGCSGRVALALTPPPSATVAKFHQLYRTSDKNEAYQAVIQLVKLCQIALTLFDKLEIDYADGLLCDVTERAINDWWLEIGTEQYGVEPHDGILGPTTVASLLGLLLGARNRLHAMSAPVTKDAFDVESMKRGISAFQKQQRLKRTRRLDIETLRRLQKATQKAADKERWAVPKAVKSTMAELSGRGGDMGMDAVARRDRAGIAEVETSDIDRFVQLLYGQRCKWLWLGKPIKKLKDGDRQDPATDDTKEGPTINKGLIFKPDEHGGFAWTAGRKNTVEGVPVTKHDYERDREYEDFITPTQTAGDETYDSDGTNNAKSAVAKRATNLRNEARSGLDKVKGVVNFRGHRAKASTDDLSPISPVEENAGHRRRPSFLRSHSSPGSPIGSPTHPDMISQFKRQDVAATGESDRFNAAFGTADNDRTETRSMIDPPARTKASRESFSKPTKADISQQGSKAENEQTHGSETVTAASSIAESVYHGVDLNETLPSGPGTGADISVLLRRTMSYSHFISAQIQTSKTDRLPRHLSFSLAEESVLGWRPVADTIEDPFGAPMISKLESQLVEQQSRAEEAKELRMFINALQSKTVVWTEDQLRLLDEYHSRMDQDQETVASIYYPMLEEMRALQSHAAQNLQQETEQLVEGGKEVEALSAKLDYEINSLRSKVEDVEAAVSDFEKGVVRMEEKVQELEKEAEKSSGWDCVLQ